MFVVVSYDITHDKRRNKVATILEGYGTRVQRSVFEVNLEPGLLRKMRRELKAAVDKDQDSIRIYTLCGACYRRIEVIGIGDRAERPPDALII